ncbi:hypothetical protein DNTS_004812 [Danionella cerebrum]|uniref:Uncharacterized protein n=1 Tax=Danionella cerebrum TaxID=2873325 RepID=A0A553RBP7_9TELE|nr:hypothetical protein DNTS_004812 [Danionella translucida]
MFGAVLPDPCLVCLGSLDSQDVMEEKGCREKREILGEP